MEFLKGRGLAQCGGPDYRSTCDELSQFLNALE
jgi:hypothetical protein